jgi:hypothetical protein
MQKIQQEKFFMPPLVNVKNFFCVTDEQASVFFLPSFFRLV